MQLPGGRHVVKFWKAGDELVDQVILAHDAPLRTLCAFREKPPGYARLDSRGRLSLHEPLRPCICRSIRVGAVVIVAVQILVREYGVGLVEAEGPQGRVTGGYRDLAAQGMKRFGSN
jgi:hypothetical protein